MHWLKRLFGEPTKLETEARPKAPAMPETPSRPVTPATADSELVFSRKTLDPKPAPRGQERAVFLANIEEVLGNVVESIDTDKLLQEDYGLDELDVSECVQCAEEVWAVQLMPNPMGMSEYKDMLRRFPTLGAIIQEAEAAGANRLPRR